MFVIFFIRKKLEFGRLILEVINLWEGQWTLKYKKRALRSVECGGINNNIETILRGHFLSHVLQKHNSSIVEEKINIVLIWFGHKWIWWGKTVILTVTKLAALQVTDWTFENWEMHSSSGCWSSLKVEINLHRRFNTKEKKQREELMERSTKTQKSIQIWNWNAFLASSPARQSNANIVLSFARCFCSCAASKWTDGIIYNVNGGQSFANKIKAKNTVNF